VVFIKLVLYSTGCPKCEVLKRKLAEKGLQYAECSSVDEMKGLEIMQVPMLDIDGALVDFRQAVDWINKYEGVGE